MWKQVKRLWDEGVLRAAPRRGIEVCSGVDLPRAPRVCVCAPVVPRWQQIAGQLRADVASGRLLPAHHTPPPKVLRAQFGATQRTIGQALRMLAREGTIERRGRSYRVAPLVSRQQSARVAVVMRGDPSGSLHLFYSQRAQEFYYALETECARAGLTPVPFAHYVVTNKFYSQSGEAFSQQEVAECDCLGLLAFPTGMPDIWFGGLLSHLAELRKPFAILDESDSAFLRGQTALLPGMRLVELGMGALHGRVMGRFIAGLGHRRAAYLSAAHQARWSRNRAEGTRQAFELHGGVLTEHVCEGPAPAVQHERLAAVTAATVRAIERFAAMGGEPGADELATVIAQLHEQAHVSVELTIPRKELRELFTSALRDRSISAWVCGNDQMAHEALAFLSERGVAVPKRISVAGFDDTDREFRQNLTSYNHNIPAIVRLMLGHILDWPPLRARPPAAGVYEETGFVNERRTSAPLRTR